MPDATPTPAVMATAPADAAVTPAEETPAPTGTEPDPAESSDESPAVVALKAALHKANKEAEKHRLRLKEIEDASKTDSEKETERVAAIERSSTENAAKALRYEVAAEKGIPLTAAARLVGATREEIAADADRFLTDFPALRVSATRIPAPDPGQGPRPAEPKSDGDQAYEAIYGAPKP